jgi:heterodisulfide reductase subunit C2
MLKANPECIKEMRLPKDFDASACINCGSCTALCPMGIDLLPRQLFRYVLMGIEEKVVANAANIFSCLLCKMCEDNCPSGVHIAENVRALRSYLIKKLYKI